MELSFLLILSILLILLSLCIFISRILLKTKKLNKENKALKDKLQQQRLITITEAGERLHAETLLKDSILQLGIVWEHSVDGMRLTDCLGNIVKVNDAFCKMVFKSRVELEGKPFTNIYKKVNEQDILAKYRLKFSERSVEPFLEKQYTLWNDEVTWFDISSSFLDMEDHGTLLLRIFRNITDRKKIQQDLENYNHKLECLNKKLEESEKSLSELNSNKDKFFSVISHDLRSPFNSLLNISEYISTDIDVLSKEEIKKFSESMYLTTKNLYNLIDVLLEWSRIQTGHVEYVPERLQLKNLVNYVISLLAGNAIIKNIHMVNSVQDGILVYADENMLSSILTNFISNSLKFTKSGGRIEVLSNLYNGMAEVTILDNGIGIEPAFLEKLFTFKGYSNPGTAMEKGTGLGLIICKEYIELNGGKMRAESEPGRTAFSFTIPCFKEN